MNLSSLSRCVSILLSTFVLPSAVHAQFTGLDVFSSQTKNTNKWGADVGTGVAELVQTNHQLHLVTTSAPGSDDFKAWPWKTNVPLSQNWTVQIDVSVPFIALPAGFSAVGVGLAALNGNDDTDVLTMNLELVRSGGPQEQNFFSSLDIDGAGGEMSMPATNSFGAVQISWNVTNQLLRASYDPDGAANGYTWTLLRSFNPSATTNWNVNLGDSCMIAVHGYAESTLVDLTNNVTIDEFYLRDDSRPALRIDRATSFVKVSWPAEYRDYHLESSGTSSAGWAFTGGLFILENDRRQTSIPLNTNQFFRLKKWN